MGDLEIGHDVDAGRERLQQFRQGRAFFSAAEARAAELEGVHAGQSMSIKHRAKRDGDLAPCGRVPSLGP